MKVDEKTWRLFDRFCLTRLTYASSTIEDRKRKLRHLERHNIDLIAFDEEEVYDYFAERLINGISNEGLNHYVKALNAWMKFKKLDIKFTRYKEHEKPIKIPTRDEVAKLLKNCKRNREGKLLKTIIFLFAHSGMRISELSNLKMDQIDYHRRTITVIGKGKKTRVIPLKQYVLIGSNFPSLHNYITYHRYKTNNRYVFTNVKGKMNTKQIRKLFKENAIDSGIEWMHPHALRHFYATTLVKKGVNLKAIQIIMGHGNIRTTSRYLHMFENDIHKAIEQVHFDDLLFDCMTNDYFENWLANPYVVNPDGPGRICKDVKMSICQPVPDIDPWFAGGLLNVF